MAKGNNFGLKTRDMGKAGTFALNAAASNRDVSYSTAGTVGERWQQFAKYAKENGIKRMEGVTGRVVVDYAREMAEKVEAGDMSAGYAQNLVSAVNTTMNLATKGRWNSVSPTKDGGIAKRHNVRTTPPGGLNRNTVTATADALRNSGNASGASVVELARDLGLRAKEASLLDARSALHEGQEQGRVTISAGTKGGRTRQVPIKRNEQLQTLTKAAITQGSARSLVPVGETWAKWEAGGLRKAREALQQQGIGRIHELRSAYAVQRYREERMTGAKVGDRAARLVIAQELGHSRIAITVSYLGSMK